VINAAIYGGDGNDTLYIAGRGADAIYGGAGNDQIIAIGGGSDQLWGEDGFDSVWSDSSDGVNDAAADETAAKAIHRVASFYQPYADEAVSLEIAGQNFRDPALDAAARMYRSYAGTAVFVDGPQYNDVGQGGVGDCYYLASLAALADVDPQVISQSITALGDGTYAVRFFRGGQEVYLRLDADLPVTTSGYLAYAKLSAAGEIWVPMLEKAYCFFRTGDNSYASISGGWMSDPLTEVTNTSSIFRYTTGTTGTLFNWMQAALSAGHALTAGSEYNASGPIVAGHAYQVKTVFTSGGTQYVTVYNPWGVDGRTWDSNTQDGLLTLTITQFQTYFSALVYSNA
jgi:hypothetical protein